MHFLFSAPVFHWVLLNSPFGKKLLQVPLHLYTLFLNCSLIFAPFRAFAHLAQSGFSEFNCRSLKCCSGLSLLHSLHLTAVDADLTAEENRACRFSFVGESDLCTCHSPPRKFTIFCVHVKSGIDFFLSGVWMLSFGELGSGSLSESELESLEWEPLTAG